MTRAATAAERAQPDFESPAGDRREHPVPCRSCRRPTWLLRPVCVFCRVLESGAASEASAAATDRGSASLLAAFPGALLFALLAAVALVGMSVLVETIAGLYGLLGG